MSSEWKQKKLLFHRETFASGNNNNNDNEKRRKNTAINVKRWPFQKLSINICILNDTATMSIMFCLLLNLKSKHVETLCRL